MIDAGPREDLPLFLPDRALIADYERNQHAGVGRIRQRLFHSVAYHRAQPVDRIRGCRDEIGYAPIACTRSNIAGCPDIALEEPRFVVETMRIKGAMRPAQSHADDPTLAGAKIGHGGRPLVARGRTPP